MRAAGPPGLALGLTAVLAACGGTSPPDPVARQTMSADKASADGASADGAVADLPPCPPSRDVRPRPDGLPDLTLRCLGPGEDVTLSGVRGTPLVLVVWASWCPPCEAETPVLDQVRRDTGGRVRFLGVDLLDTPDDAAAAAREWGMGFPSVRDPEGLVRDELDVPGPPVTVLVDARGRVVHREVGELTRADRLRDLLDRHLGVRT